MTGLVVLYVGLGKLCFMIYETTSLHHPVYFSSEAPFFTILYDRKFIHTPKLVQSLEFQFSFTLLMILSPSALAFISVRINEI
jgi:hypothetical protein